ncbi:MAG: PASTA domain-containing protein, partial [Chloroflexi bacterium]|nr:PASTA domain-containing protein [Chloroflexota bacterium]
MTDPNTPKDPLSAPLWNPAEPDAAASGLTSDATQLWDPSEVPTGAATSADLGAANAADVVGVAAGPAADGAESLGTPAAWSPDASQMAAGTTPPLGTDGAARGVAAGRPRMPEVPPTGRTTPPVAIVGGVIGLAIVVALGAWFLLLRPGPNTAVASPSPSPIVSVTPSPEPTETATELPTLEPTDDSTPAPTPFKAPSFTGKTLDEAQALADSGGLQLDIRFDITTNKADGTVLSQAPPPGSAVLPGDQIFLVVAQPGPNVLVPDIQGVAEADAVNLLLDSDLRPGERTEAIDPDVEAGAVISTDPAAGDEVERGGSVDYVVSIGARPTPSPTPATVIVPELVGVDENDAFNQLLDADLSPGDRSEAFDAEISSGAVIRTDPEAGTE